jgi:glycosyltransferase involved in cell wall biosynthesis
MRLAIIYQNLTSQTLISVNKPGYFNPGSYFDEILMITFDNSIKDTIKSKLNIAFGGARIRFVSAGGVSLHNYLFKRNYLLKTIKEFQPDIIRTYSPQIDGYIATYIGRKIKVPVIISLHGDRDRDNRHNMKLEKKYFKYLGSLIHRFLFEIPSLKRCSQIIGVYEFAAEYGKRYSNAPVTVIYNRVDTNLFLPSTENVQDHDFTIINVGRMIPAKNQELLIRAMKHVEGRLILVGDGLPTSESVTKSK